MRRFPTRSLIFGLALAAASGAASAAYAPDPIEPPLISLDAASPTLPLTGLSAADVLTAPPPTVFVPSSMLGLTPMDDLDAFSRGPGPRTSDTYALLFSVERGMFEGAPPDANLASLGYEYNAFQQANLNQAATDMFMTTSLFDNSGQRRGPRSPSNNVLVRDGGDAGGTDFSLIPGAPITVDDPNPGEQDNINGLGDPNGNKNAGREGDLLYFTLQRQSPSLPDLPGIGSPADIYYIDLNVPGLLEVFAIAPDLGLQPADNISSMLVIRASPSSTGPFAPGDQVLFTLDQNSPTRVALGAATSDLLVVGHGSPINFYAEGGQLGLSFDARISALTYYLTDDIFRTVLRHGIKNGPVVGDLDGDGDVDQGDLGELLAAWNQSDGGDIDGDGDTDQSDLGLLLSNYGFGT